MGWVRPALPKKEEGKSMKKNWVGTQA